MVGSANKKKRKTDETSIPFVKSKTLEKILFVKTLAVNEEQSNAKDESCFASHLTLYDTVPFFLVVKEILRRGVT